MLVRSYARSSLSVPLCPSRPGRTRQAGFTIIELVIVLAMIAVVSAIALPRIDADRFHVDGAAEDASLAVMVAQREAVARQHQVLLILDTGNQTIRTVWDANSNGVQDATEHVRDLALGERIRIGRSTGVPALGTRAASVSVMRTCGAKPCLIMQRNGSTDREAWFYLTSRRAMEGATGRLSDARMVEIARASGRAQVWKYTGAAWMRLP